MCYEQLERKAFYIHPVFGIPLRDLREEFNLKSTFFSCYPEGNEVVIKGRGFGHGVGLEVRCSILQTFCFV